jgi:hypothetical protein
MLPHLYIVATSILSNDSNTAKGQHHSQQSGCSSHLDEEVRLRSRPQEFIKGDKTKGWACQVKVKVKSKSNTRDGAEGMVRAAGAGASRAHRKQNTKKKRRQERMERRNSSKREQLK